MSATFGTGGQNAMKKQQNFILSYLSLKFLCDQIIKKIGLILRLNVFGVTIVLFFVFLLICKYVQEANELIHKQVLLLLVKV